MFLIFTTFLICGVLVINFIPSSLGTSKDIIVESSGAASPKDIDTTKSVHENNTIVVPYLNPLGEAEYNELKERANLGNLSQVRNVTTLELPSTTESK